ncbi:MAG: DedA family protein [Cytophagaceae bacterium]|jgi:membrane-associated protein|nr:DedA family protein [Cytophagaceae bacterium]
MEQLKQILHFFLHLDEKLIEYIALYGNWTYAIIFAIVFVETGLVIMPLLPGDSLLFAVGSLCAIDSLNLMLSMVLLFIAAVLGDTLNYSIGRSMGPVVFEKDYRFIKKKYLIQAQEFYEKHGGKAIIIARFVPIVRTFAPFVAGIGKMNYQRFLLFNILGAFVWVVGLTMLGFLFGNIPIVKNNFELVIFGIIGLSLLPIVFAFLKEKLS